MAQLTQMELNTIKELVGLEDVNAKKFHLYAANCTDDQLKSILSQEAQQAFNNTQILMGFLNQ